MQRKLDWNNEDIVNVFDEVTLWSAPFGKLLLENIPMQPNSTVVDLGFGTGFPLIELSQRFGSKSKIYGVDIWSEGIRKAKEKIKVFEISNIEIFEQSASAIPLKDNYVDLICSNLGVNNFGNKEDVYKECFRILKTGGKLCLTTNPIGTFTELFEIFKNIVQQYNEPDIEKELNNYINHRGTIKSISKEISEAGFSLVKEKSAESNFRFCESQALLDHSLIRLGFIESWENLIPSDLRSDFFQKLIIEVDKEIDGRGEITLTVPMLYLEFEK
ncbi:MAG: class I SAM-dependent methyltransferase [Bacteroidia bacterium]|nr:class I SAM-dependent methyltransferase [Bacteroidia bacterium]